MSNEYEQAKIILIGLGKAGKTSIHNRFFMKSTIEEIKGIKPTILLSLTAPVIERLKRQIEVYDLGGQKEFIAQHVQNRSLFQNCNAIIFVVDVREPERIEEVRNYVEKVTKLVNLNKPPTIFVFCHKYDPEIRKEKEANFALIEFMNKLNTAFEPFKPIYYFTSIYDESVFHAMIQVLGMAVPDAILSEISLHMLSDVYEPLWKSFSEKVNTSLMNSIKRQKLRKYAAQFGSIFIQARQKEWQEEEYTKLQQKVQVQISEGHPKDSIEAIKVSNNQVEVSFICPFKEKSLKEIDPTVYCEITHGILDGMAATLNYKMVLRKNTFFEDNSYKCVFEMKQ